MIAPGRVLVPPRPNPGPEPLPQPSFNAYWLLGLIPAFIVLAALWSFARRRRARRTGFTATGIPGGDSTAIAPPTPAEEMLRLAGTVRKDLIDRLGPVWRSRTTQELASSPELLDAFGSHALAEFVQFLDQVDQLKFAPMRRLDTDLDSADSELERWQPVIEGLRTRLSSYTPKPPQTSGNGSGDKKLSRRNAQPRSTTEPRAAPL